MAQWSTLPKVSIVLLNYNGAEDTIECLESLKNITYKNYNIVIVDNASTDDSMKKIGTYLQSIDSGLAVCLGSKEANIGDTPQMKLTLIQTSHNGGYGHGNNVGIKYVLEHGADYVLILNNDTVVDPGFLDPMVKLCENDKNVGIASCKIYFHDRPDVIWFNGGKFYPYTAKVEHFNFNEKDIGQKPPDVISFISGCLWLIPKNIFNEVGFINEDYFMYVEDLEYAQRVQKAGYTLKVLEQSHIFHKVGGSTGGKLSAFSVYWRTKNMIKFIKDQHPNIFSLIISTFIFNIKLFINLIREKKYTLVAIQIKAIIDAIR